MQNFFLISLLFLQSLSTAQTLNFEVKATYSVGFESLSFERSVYGTTNDYNYFMQFAFNSKNKLVAQVYDLKLLKCHEYLIVNTDTVEKKLKFIYSKTKSFDLSSQSKIYFDFKTINKSDTIDKVNLKVFESKSKQTIKNSFDLEIINSNFNFFPLFRFACFHPSEFYTEFDYGKEGLVKTCISSNGLIKHTLLSFEQTNFEIVLPDKI